MSGRPRLRPGLRQVWRDPATLQVGLSPGPGVVISGLGPGDEAVIAALDGAHDLEQLRATGATHRLPRRRVEELLALLEPVLLPAGQPAVDRAHLSRLGAAGRARLAPDADAWALAHGVDGERLAARRAGRHVEVRGAGRVGSVLAATLVAAGVGAVRLVDERPVRAGDVHPGGPAQADVGAAWAGVHARVRERVTGSPEAAPASGPPDLVVLVARDVVDARAGDDLVRRAVAHLAVVVATDRVLVGPLVLPGRGPCLRCLDLRRAERDPAWPHLLAQLLTRRRPDGPAGETALATAAAGTAALQVLAQLDGRVEPAAFGRTIELSLPQGSVRRRRWSAHPGCGCARAAGPPNGSRGRRSRPDPTMVP